MGQDVTRDGKYVTPIIDFLTEEGAKRSRFLNAGTLVMICSGDVGVPSILAVDACVHDGFLAFPEISETCDKEYLYYVFDSLRLDFDKSATHGGIFTNLTTGIIKDFKIALSSLAEQQKIAEILSSVDEKIDVIDAQITQTQELKKGLMQRLLTKGIGHTKYKLSLWGEIPQDWECNKLKDLITIKHGFAFEGSGFTRETTPHLLLTPGNFKIEGGMKFEWEKQKYYSGNVPKEYVLKKGSLIVALTDLTQSCDILGSPAIIPDEKFNYLHNQRLGLVTIMDEARLALTYLYHIFNSPNFRNYMKSTKTGTTVSHTSPKTIYEFDLPIPPIDEQLRISKILSLMDEKTDVLSKKQSSYTKLKKALMQQLLTGRIRVNHLIKNPIPA